MITKNPSASSSSNQTTVNVHVGNTDANATTPKSKLSGYSVQTELKVKLPPFKPMEELPEKFIDPLMQTPIDNPVRCLLTDKGVSRLSNQLYQKETIEHYINQAYKNNKYNEKDKKPLDPYERLEIEEIKLDADSKKEIELYKSQLKKQATPITKLGVEMNPEQAHEDSICAQNLYAEGKLAETEAMLEEMLKHTDSIKAYTLYVAYIAKEAPTIKLVQALAVLKDLYVKNAQELEAASTHAHALALIKEAVKHSNQDIELELFIDVCNKLGLKNLSATFQKRLKGDNLTQINEQKPAVVSSNLNNTNERGQSITTEDQINQIVNVISRDNRSDENSLIEQARLQNENARLIRESEARRVAFDRLQETISNISL